MKKKDVVTNTELEGKPFETVEELWFWFIAACEAREDGALMRMGNGGIMRPCEPSDILKVLQKLHRNRILTMDHFRVMAHYGKRHFAPDRYKKLEERSYYLWWEGLDALASVLIKKKILKDNLYKIY